MKVVANEALKVTDIKVFDNLTQSDTNDCSTTACPGLLLSTPLKCHCVCADGYSLNASGTKCIAQVNYTTVATCGPGQFKCFSDNGCISEKYLCDGDFDCKDGSDESELKDGPCNASQNCTNLGKNALRCDGDRCIIGSAVCDGVTTCADASDEDPELCTHVDCSDDSKYFQCKQTKQCLPIAWVMQLNFTYSISQLKNSI